MGDDEFSGSVISFLDSLRAGDDEDYGRKRPRKTTAGDDEDRRIPKILRSGDGEDYERKQSKKVKAGDDEDYGRRVPKILKSGDDEDYGRRHKGRKAGDDEDRRIKAGDDEDRRIPRILRSGDDEDRRIKAGDDEDYGRCLFPIKKEHKSAFDDWMKSRGFNPKDPKIEACFERLLADAGAEIKRLKRVAG
jgi:hypothetical protein